MKLLKAALCFAIVFLSIGQSAYANLPDQPLQFPRDNAAHYDNVPYAVTNMTEWWYYNGKIVTTTGRQFGYSLTTFNIILDIFGNKLSIPTFMVQVTDIDRNKVYGKVMIYPADKTHYSTTSLDILLNNKDLLLQEHGGVHHLESELESKQGVTLRLTLDMTPSGPVLVEGKDGIVPIGPDNNAYYYANTRMQTTGTLQVGDEKLDIDHNKSSSWMEHVWGDFLLSVNYPWYFANIRLDNGVDINLVNFLDLKTKEPTDLNHANVRYPDGTSQYLTTGIKLNLSEESPYPHRYEISIAENNMHLYLESLADGQDVDGWWEGIAKVEGTYENKPVHGFCYVQITSPRSITIR